MAHVLVSWHTSRTCETSRNVPALAYPFHPDPGPHSCQGRCPTATGAEEYLKKTRGHLNFELFETTLRRLTASPAACQYPQADSCALRQRPSAANPTEHKFGTS